MLLILLSTGCAWAQQSGSCANLANFKAENVEITKAVAIAAETTEAIPWNQAHQDFAYLANVEVAALAKQLIAQHYGNPAALCSREKLSSSGTSSEPS